MVYQDDSDFFEYAQFRLDRLKDQHKEIQLANAAFLEIENTKACDDIKEGKGGDSPHALFALLHNFIDAVISNVEISIQFKRDKKVLNDLLLLQDLIFSIDNLLSLKKENSSERFGSASRRLFEMFQTFQAKGGKARAYNDEKHQKMNKVIQEYESRIKRGEIFSRGRLKLFYEQMAETHELDFSSIKNRIEKYKKTSKQSS